MERGVAPAAVVAVGVAPDGKSSSAWQAEANYCLARFNRRGKLFCL
jgi:hypothetical protein